MKLNGDLIMDEQKEQNNIRNKKSLIECRGVDVFYGDKQALFGINLDIGEKEVTSLIGPSGCGKSTFLRCINRMNDVIEICKVEGTIKIDNEDIYHPDVDVVELRSRIGMVFQNLILFLNQFTIMLPMGQNYTVGSCIKMILMRK